MDLISCKRKGYFEREVADIFNVRGLPILALLFVMFPAQCLVNDLLEWLLFFSLIKLKNKKTASMGCFMKISIKKGNYKSLECAVKYSATPLGDAFIPALPSFHCAGHTSPFFW